MIESLITKPQRHPRMFFPPEADPPLAEGDRIPARLCEARASLRLRRSRA